eukprot:2708-Heterococcus_DN1.PRE.1
MEPLSNSSNNGANGLSTAADVSGDVSEGLLTFVLGLASATQGVAGESDVGSLLGSVASYQSVAARLRTLVAGSSSSSSGVQVLEEDRCNYICQEHDSDVDNVYIAYTHSALLLPVQVVLVQLLSTIQRCNTTPNACTHHTCTVLSDLPQLTRRKPPKASITAPYQQQQQQSSSATDTSSNGNTNFSSSSSSSAASKAMYYSGGPPPDAKTIARMVKEVQEVFGTAADANGVGTGYVEACLSLMDWSPELKVCMCTHATVMESTAYCSPCKLMNYLRVALADPQYTALHYTTLHYTTYTIPHYTAVAAALASGEESHLPAQLKGIPRTLQKAWRGKQTENERGYSVDADAAATARALIVAREREEELNSMAFLRYVRMIQSITSACIVRLLDREHAAEAAAIAAAVARPQCTTCRLSSGLTLFCSAAAHCAIVQRSKSETREYDDDYDDQYDDVQPSVPAVTSELAACCCAVHKCALILSILHSGALRVAQCSWLQRSPDVTTAVCSHMRAFVHAAALGQAAVSCTQPLPRRIAALAAQLLNCCQQLQC